MYILIRSDIKNHAIGPIYYKLQPYGFVRERNIDKF